MDDNGLSCRHDGLIVTSISLALGK